MATSFLPSTATAASMSDQVARIPEPAIPERFDATTKAEPTELPASPVATTKSNEPTELPASPITNSISKIVDITEDGEAPKNPAMSNEKKDWISDEKHNGPRMENIKHDQRAGSGIEFVSPLEEEEKQLHQASPQNEELSPKYPTPILESKGLEVLPGQNQGNTAVYINHEEEGEARDVNERAEDGWHYTLCSCWSQGGLCMSFQFILQKVLSANNPNRRRISLLSLRSSRPNTPTPSQPTNLKQPLYPHSFHQLVLHVLLPPQCPSSRGVTSILLYDVDAEKRGEVQISHQGQ